MMKQENVRVTYLITTLNRGKFLKETLANVREFITPEDELIIIDGLSIDGTQEIVEQNKDIVTIFLSEKDFGEAHAFNKGLFRARGRYIKPITDDDHYYPDSMRQLIQEMERNPDLDAIQCGGENWKLDNGNLIFCGLRCVPSQIEATAEAIFDFAFAGQGLMMRRSAFERIGGVNGSCASVDGEIMVKLIECKCNIRYLDLRLFKWVWYPHSGMNKATALASDFLKFDVRIGRWDRIFWLEPDALIRVLECKERPDWINQIYGMWAIGFIARSRVGFLLRLFGKLIRLMVKIKISLSSLRLRFWRGTDFAAKCEIGHQWSGTLR
jgi:glycosyltransferase involved in cell wall biosynthesis